MRRSIRKFGRVVWLCHITKNGDWHPRAAQACWVLLSLAGGLAMGYGF